MVGCWLFSATLPPSWVGSTQPILSCLECPRSLAPKMTNHVAWCHTPRESCVPAHDSPWTMKNFASSALGAVVSSVVGPSYPGAPVVTRDRQWNNSMCQALRIAVTKVKAYDTNVPIALPGFLNNIFLKKCGNTQRQHQEKR